MRQNTEHRTPHKYILYSFHKLNSNLFFPTFSFFLVSFFLFLFFFGIRFHSIITNHHPLRDFLLHPSYHPLFYQKYVVRKISQASFVLVSCIFWVLDHELSLTLKIGAGELWLIPSSIIDGPSLSRFQVIDTRFFVSNLQSTCFR